MLTGLLLPSLACKWVFYGPENNAKSNPMEMNFEGFEMQKRNIPMDINQRADENNGVISLVIMFTPTIMVFKISKWFIFLSLADNSKKIFTVLAKIFKCT